MQEHTAEEELRKLQVLAGALQNVNKSSTAHLSTQELNESMDALSQHLDDFEKRFASADPDVKQMLAHLISNPSLAEELALASDTPNMAPQHHTPNSSDSAQTQSATDSAQQQRWACSPPNQGGHNVLLQSSPVRPMPSQSHRVGDVETSPMFPALTPSNSLAQQVTSREALSDCAASFPSMLPAMNRKDAALANQLRHRLAGIDQPSTSANIRESLTQVSISEAVGCTSPGN